MSFKTIKELRQAGKLEEALHMANQALEAEPDNIWNKRAAAWVYYDYLKKASQPETFDLFKENLIKLKDLQLPEDEKMVFDSCAWQIGRLVFALQKTEPVDHVKINVLFGIIKDFHFTKPSEAYSFIYKAFHKGYHIWSKYIAFADWWDFKNFISEDYLQEAYNGNKNMSLVEQAFIAYSKCLLDETHLLEHLPEGRKSLALKLIDKGVKVKVGSIQFELINSFLPKLDELIDKHPHYQYPPYFKAKLLLALGTNENVLSAFLPFARQKRNDFWVWELMAEMFSHDQEIQFSCYCKALSLKTPEDFLVKLRQTFAGILVGKSMHDEAKTEIQKIIETRTKAGWKIPSVIETWTNQPWYQNARALKDNSSLYNQHIQKAEEILFADIPAEYAVVEFVNSDKKMLNFIVSESVYGFFKYDRFLKKVRVGDTLAIRIQDGSKGGFYKVLTCKVVDNSPFKNEFVKEVTGIVRIKDGSNFGFLEDAFVHPSLVKKYNLENGSKYSGTAIKSFDDKKEKWGWKLAF